MQESAKTNLPPQIIRRQARDLTGMTQGIPGDQLSSLPVLSAFQEFLETERRRTRRRLLSLAIVLVSVFLAIGGASWLVAVRVFNGFVESAQRMQAQMTSMRSESATLREDVMKSLGAAAGESERIGRWMTAKEEAWAAAEDLPRQLAAYSNDLAALRNVLTNLATSNTALRGEIEQLRNAVSSMERTAASAGAQQASSPRSDNASRAGSPAAPAATTRMTLSLVPADQREPIPWRVIIPE